MYICLAPSYISNQTKTKGLKTGRTCTYMYVVYSGHHGDFLAEIPLLLNDNVIQPYSSVTLTASVPVGRITMSTKRIVLSPVPLDITLSAQYTLLVQDFPRCGIHLFCHHSICDWEYVCTHIHVYTCTCTYSTLQWMLYGVLVHMYICVCICFCDCLCMQTTTC